MAGARESWKTSGIMKGPGIPAPTGQYRVGCVDLMQQLEGDDRGLLVRLYYPTEATPEAGYTYSNWYPHKNYIKGALSVYKPKFLSVLSAVTGVLVAPKMPALEGAPLFGCDSKTEDPREGDPEASATPPPYPVIVFSHGLGAFRTAYSGLIADLVSHGYVVASVEHRHKSAAVTLQRVPKVGGKEGELQDQWLEYELHDVVKVEEDEVRNAELEFPYRNKQVKLRADDVKKSLDILTLLNEGAEIKDMLGGNYDFKQFKGRLDVSTAAVMGHSYGGATTIQTLYEDSRFKCGIALDSWVIPIHEDIYGDNTSISQPLYFINSYNFQWKENMKRMLSLTRPPDPDGTSTCRVITMKGTHHYSQTDVPFTTPGLFTKILPPRPLSNPLDIHTAHQLNLELCHAFLQRHLLKYPSFQQIVPNLDGTEGHSEHLLFGTNLGMSDKPTDTSDSSEGGAQGVVSTEEGVASTREGNGGVVSTEEANGGVVSTGEEGAASTEEANGGVVSTGEEGVAFTEEGNGGVVSTEEANGGVVSTGEEGAASTEEAKGVVSTGEEGVVSTEEGEDGEEVGKPKEAEDTKAEEQETI